MKKLLVIAIACILSIGVHAQTVIVPAGTKIINPTLTNLGFNHISLGIDGLGDNTSINRTGLSVAVGYAVIDNLVAKGEVAYQGISVEDSNISLISIGAGARMYLPVPNLFAGAGLNYTRGAMKDKGLLDEYNDFGSSNISVGFVDIRIEAGYSLFISKSFAIEPSISYGMKILGGKINTGSDYGDDAMKIKYNNLNLNIGFSLFF